MDRKEFFRKSLQSSIACSGLLLSTGHAALSEPNCQQQEAKDRSQKFKEDWLISLMRNMDGQLEKGERESLMVACGRDCARRGAMKLAESCKGDVGKLVESLAGFLGKEGNYIEGNTVHLTYTKCYCHLVDQGPERLSETYCNCSRGWVLEMFETAAAKPVEVEVLQTIKRGAPSCKFIVKV